jgi:23S rRNA pseudouridine1911/1915/1917 synthase
MSLSSTDLSKFTSTNEYVSELALDQLNLEPIHLHIPNNLSGARLDLALATIIPELSRSRLTNWIKEGHVSLNGEFPKPKDKVFSGDNVVITPLLSEEVLAFTPENIPLDIIFEDEHILILDKPRGLIVHPGNGNWHGTLLNGLLYHYPQLRQIPRAGIVHRLDKDTTGLMVVAKTLLAQTSLVRQLQERSVSRIYRAIVEGHVAKTGIINKNIGRDPNRRTQMKALEIGGKEAITHYRVLEYFSDFSYIECQLETGRTHQIRVHFKSISHPLVADPVYGSNKINYPNEIAAVIKEFDRQALHALKLKLIHPLTQQEMLFESTLAEDFHNLLKVLQINQAQIANTLDEDNDFLDTEDEVEVIYEH